MLRRGWSCGRGSGCQHQQACHGAEGIREVCMDFWRPGRLKERKSDGLIAAQVRGALLRRAVGRHQRTAGPSLHQLLPRLALHRGVSASSHKSFHGLQVPSLACPMQGRAPHAPIVQRVDVDARLCQQQPNQGGSPVPRRHVQELALIHRPRIDVTSRSQVPRQCGHITLLGGILYISGHRSRPPRRFRGDSDDVRGSCFPVIHHAGKAWRTRKRSLWWYTHCNPQSQSAHVRLLRQI
mmetsp:Transcript_19811/g.59844  ORF Transcript_19811/g.59844 Transcript_19811/m.59844 type:complete len:238 (+) Transcript_19811:278-991(+)